MKEVTMKSTMKIILGITLFLFLIAAGCKDRDLSRGGLSQERMQKLAKTGMVPIEAAIDTFHLNCGFFPNTLDDLLTCPPGLEGKWAGPYIKSINLLDPWGNPYVYVPAGNINTESYDIISYGADGKPGGEGFDKDIYNEQTKLEDQ
jgi:general secretion pathway protein G